MPLRLRGVRQQIWKVSTPVCFYFLPSSHSTRAFRPRSSVFRFTKCVFGGTVLNIGIIPRRCCQIDGDCCKSGDESTHDLLDPTRLTFICYQQAAVHPVATATLPDVAKTVLGVAKETLVAHPVRAAAAVEDAVSRGTFQTFPPSDSFLISLGVGTIAPWLMINAGAARMVKLAILLLNAPNPITFFALGRTSAAVSSFSPQQAGLPYSTPFTSSDGIPMLPRH